MVQAWAGHRRRFDTPECGRCDNHLLRIKISSLEEKTKSIPGTSCTFSVCFFAKAGETVHLSSRPDQCPFEVRACHSCRSCRRSSNRESVLVALLLTCSVKPLSIYDIGCPGTKKKKKFLEFPNFGCCDDRLENHNTCNMVAHHSFIRHCHTFFSLATVPTVAATKLGWCQTGVFGRQKINRQG